jgi:dTDP-4-amino-4,6-dideoxygalactose transaminase
MIRLVEPIMGEEEFQAVREVLASGYLVQGEQVRRFEELVAAYLGLEEVVAVSSGTAALHLALLALGIGHGDEVIVPDFTFPATANVVALTGARPVLADVRLDTFNLDAGRAEALVTSRTRAIMPVHLFGLAAAMDEIQALAERHGLYMVEDAACALGAEYNGQKCGTFGRMGCFSLHPRKAITTGEGGLIASRDGELADRLRALRNHGLEAGPEGARFVAAGLNYRMTEFQGALGGVQMRALEARIASRRALAAAYDAALAGIPWLRRPLAPVGCRHVYQSYVVLLDGGLDRTQVMASLRERGVESTLGTYACHAQPFYQERYGYQPGAAPYSYQAFQRTLALPLHERMSATDVDLVVAALRRSGP